MIQVTVLLLDGGHASTAIAPIDVFRSAGVLWPALRGEAARGALRGDLRLALEPQRVLGRRYPHPRRPRVARRATHGPDRGAVLRSRRRRRAAPLRAVVSWLKRWHARGAAVAGICSGVALLAETGLLDGKPATTHWALADGYRERWPRVDWQPEHFVTETGRLFCAGRRLRGARSLAPPGGTLRRLRRRDADRARAAARDAAHRAGRLRGARRTAASTATRRSPPPRSGCASTCARRCAWTRWRAARA